MPLEQAAPRPLIRFRAILLGLLLMPINIHWVVAMGQFRKSGDATTVSIFFNCVFTLLVIELLNHLVERRRPALALNRIERITIYTMIASGCGIAGRDFIQVALPLWGYPHFHATPENNWAAKFLDDIPRGLTVTNKEALKGYFQGHSTLYTLPHLRAWLTPVVYWCAFFSMIQIVMLSINILIRQQWTDREKLSFPILQVPLEITTPKNTLWRSNAFWLGFGLAAAIDIVNGLHTFVPQVPFLNVKMTNLQPFFSSPWMRKIGFTPVEFFPFAVGIAYLLPTDLSFSCWFFYVFFKAQLALAGYFGYDASMGWDGQQGTLPFVNEQGIGAYLAFGLFALWSARTHLREVFRRALHPREPEDRMYTFAVVAIGVGLVWWMLFSRYCGFTPWIGFAYCVLYYLVTTTITKIRAELGPPVHDLHFGGPDRMLLTWIGVSGLGRMDRMGFTLFFGFNRAYRGVPQPMMLEGMRAAEMEHASQRRLVWALALSAPVAAFSAAWAMLHWSYLDGMQFALESYRIGGQTWPRLDSWINQPWGAGAAATGAMAVGAVVFMALMTLRLRFVGFWFHPIGYAISANWAMNCVWLPILIGWALKALIMKYSGAKGYRAGIPAAMGLILGEFVVGSIWSLYGILAHVQVYKFWLF
ncbi:MAG: hypothetical protein HYU66_12450 [Armatimonadetes bacterium]|nr:hypothetical protein [Armatimonadota bacterium]